MDWPNTRTGSQNIPTIIEDRGFQSIHRVSYWINALNPIGGTTTIENDLHYTASVGYGPGTNGLYLRASRLSAFPRPETLIATADGVYAGRHRDNKIRTPNSRIGYRHPGKGGGAVNAAFADGHVKIVHADEFPRGTGPNNAGLAEARQENLNGKPTVYADPERILGP
jgi:prepilin-type processing-associated H-X9-DG protein